MSMQTKNLSFFRSIIISLILFTMIGAGHTIQARDCNTVCNYYAECVINFHGGIANANQRRKLSEGCKMTCAKHKAKTMACYKQGKQSCTKFWSCVEAGYRNG